MKKIFIIFFLCLLNPAFAIQEEYINLNWWSKFNDENLVQNLLILCEKNHDMKNAALKIKENEQMVKIQFADELPGVYMSGGFSRDFRASREQFGSMKIPNFSQYNYNFPINAGYEVDIWGKNRLKTKSKKEELEIIKQLERATYISMTSDFASDYFNLIKADKLIEIQKELIKTQTEILTKQAKNIKPGFVR